MLFNSLSFAVFLPIVFLVHWLIIRKDWKVQNIWLLAASYFFYGCWDWRFVFLLFFSTYLDYFTGIKIANAEGESGKKFWLWLSISINLGFLGIFKYYNFFISSLVDAGVELHFSTLQVILPVGISFYTFHGLSYVIDIYYKRIIPEKNFVTYAVFVSFFPLLVAGPIERATHLLPQVKRTRHFDRGRAISGLRQILWGLFKKIVIADNCASLANDIFAHWDTYPGSTLAIGAVMFAFQIYGDFSGYSDIALGTARLFGIDLLNNFAYPYFSRDIAEFWRRWHISLSSWFKDYVYIPLGGSKGGLWMRIRNTFIIFLLSGFWHGANWTFVIWGLLNALYIMPSILLKSNRTNISIVAEGKTFPTLFEVASILMTFSLTVVAWVFFRAESVGQAVQYLLTMFSRSLFQAPSGVDQTSLLIIAAFLAFLIVIEWTGRHATFPIYNGIFKNEYLRYSFYCLLAVLVLLYYGTNQEFIYFQF